MSTARERTSERAAIMDGCEKLSTVVDFLRNSAGVNGMPRAEVIDLALVTATALVARAALAVAEAIDSARGEP